MTHFICTLAVVLAVLCLPFIVILWATESPAARARRWHRAGISQRECSRRLGVSRHRVRAWVAA
jgi:hypothetical protein